MRWLMYLTIGFTLACFVLVYIETMLWRVALVVAIIILLAVLNRRNLGVPKSILILLGCAVGILWFGRYYHNYLCAAIQMDGRDVYAQIRTVDYSYETRYGMAVEGTVDLAGKTYRVLTYLDAANPLPPARRLSGNFHFQVTVQGDISYYAGEGIFLVAYQTDELLISSADPTWTDSLVRIRRGIKALLSVYFPEDTVAFAKALLLGDSGDLGYAVDSALKVSGIRHVVAVSGLHVSILIALLSALCFRKRSAMVLAGAPMLFCFAALAGFSPSVTRACIMSALMLLALFVGKEYDGPTALSFSVLVMLVQNPLMITSVSLQLSVSSVAGIFLFSEKIQKWILSIFKEQKERSWKKRLIGWAASSVSVSLSAMSITTPFCAYYFGMVSLVGVITNLLTLWVISAIFYGIMGVCVLHLVFPAAAEMLAICLSELIRYVLWCAETLASVPLAAVYTCSIYVAVWLVLLYTLLLFFLAGSKRDASELICCAVIGLCIALLASWLEPAMDEVRFSVLDVGQGQCLLLQSEGYTFLVDCGGDSDAKTADIAAHTLLSQGITKLDGMILTHNDRDHAGAVANLLSRVDTRLLILPPVRSEIAESTDGEVIYATEDIQLDFGNTVIRIFVPTFPGNSNENSLCILFDTEKCDILITSDRNGFGEQSLLRNADIPDVDVLVAGHHGSKNSTCEELLLAVRPEIVCISAGAGNSYGHPAPELLQRLQEFGCAVFRTDLHGTILIQR